MQIPVLVEPVAGNGFRARGSEPFALVGEGATREAAVAQFSERLRQRMQFGAVIMPVEIAAGKHPLEEFVGMFKDDPLIAEWKVSMAEYRSVIDAEADGI